MQVSLTTDSKGFISQECPNCERRFKAQFGKGNDKPILHCPYCNHEGKKCWWTKEQAEYFTGSVANAVLGPRFGARAVARPPEPEDEAFATTTFDCCAEVARHEMTSAVYCVICGTATVVGASTPS